MNDCDANPDSGRIGIPYGWPNHLRQLGDQATLLHTEIDAVRLTRHQVTAVGVGGVADSLGCGGVATRESRVVFARPRRG